MRPIRDKKGLSLAASNPVCDLGVGKGLSNVFADRVLACGWGEPAWWPKGCPFRTGRPPRRANGLSPYFLSDFGACTIR